MLLSSQWVQALSRWLTSSLSNWECRRRVTARWRSRTSGAHFARVLTLAGCQQMCVKMHSSPLVQCPALYRLQISLPSAVYAACGGVVLLDLADRGPRWADMEVFFGWNLDVLVLWHCVMAQTYMSALMVSQRKRWDHVKLPGRTNYLGVYTRENVQCVNF